MKTKSLYLAVFLLGFISWGCNKNNDSTENSASLKTSLNSGVQNLTTAMNEITTSTGYQVLTGSNDATLKSALISPIDTMTQSILLANITGVYDYKATTFKRGMMSIMRFFNKTGESSGMTVRLPEEKVKSWKSLLHFTPADTLLKNNYVVTLSDYMYKFKPFVGYDYQIASAIKIKDVDAGALKIKSSRNKTYGYNYASEFAFPNGYVTKCQYTSGDTAISSYAISKDAKTLYEEKYTAIKSKTDVKHKERSFSLTIGNVLIERKLGMGEASLDSAKVYVGGVLQLKAKVEIIDNDSDENDQSVTSMKRELKITFDDGTSATFSELAGSAVTDISTLFASMRQVNFATNIIDWIAWDIYTKKK